VPSQGQAVHRESHRLGTIDYEITIYAAPGGLYGVWRCSKCQASGTNSLFSSTKEDATNNARDAASSHHLSTHSD
jgi:hypothetical protein